MGQYHHAVCPSKGSSLHPSAFGSGSKQAEITGSGAALMDAVAIRIADPSGSRLPGDLHIPRQTGAWAGEPVFFIGDYAENGDARRWPWNVAEGDCYGHSSTRKAKGQALAPHVLKLHGYVAGYEEWKTVDQAGKVIHTSRTLQSIPISFEGGKAMLDEAGCYPHQVDAHRKQLQAMGDLGDLDEKDYAIDASEGQRRVIVNLDLKEYVDPYQMGEIPTLAGICRATVKNYDARRGYGQQDWTPSAIEATCNMLFHGEARGGGDRDGPMVGRWRTDRILITAEQSRKHITTDQVISDPTFRNLTSDIMIANARVDWAKEMEMRNLMRFPRQRGAA